MMSVEWTEKFRPKTLDEVVGNPGAINDLKEWAESWERGIPKKRAVILMGEAGIGKTSSALALAVEYGWGAVELNASDLRNADVIRRIATSGALNETFTDSGEYVSTRHGGRKLIILDEADNIFGKEDTGGLQTITNTIKETKQPMVLIVNDYYELVRRSPGLRKLCLTIKFSRIHRSTIIRVLRNICLREDVTVSNEALITLAEHSNGDLRSAINDLQSLSLGKKKLSEKDVTVLGHRDTKSTIFKVISEIFKATSYKRALESTYDLDEDLNHLLLWIDENLPAEYKKSEDLGRAYLPLSKASIYLARVKRRQFYKFWSYANDMMTAGVALSKTNVYQGYTKYQFPSWLTKMSRSKGIRATRKSLNEKLSSAYHTSQYVAQSTIYPYLKYLFENEREFTLYSIRNLDLDSEEVAFILGESVDSVSVRQLFDESRAIEGPKKEEKEGIKGLKWDEGESEEERDQKEGEKGQSELSDF
jgi:replication factor C large subunit